MSFKEYVTFIFKKMVLYMETPKSERKAMKEKRKEPWLRKWFGMIPFSVKMYMDNKKSSNKN